MKRVHTLRAKVGTYMDKQTGTERASYRTVGYVLQGDKGMMIKLDTIPMNWEGWAYFGDLESAQAKQAAQNAQPEGTPAGGDFQDDIPFAPYMRDSIA